jgi:hypothetical protein
MRGRYRSCSGAPDSGDVHDKRARARCGRAGEFFFFLSRCCESKSAARKTGLDVPDHGPDRRPNWVPMSVALTRFGR